MADTVGNRLGRRATFLYITDSLEEVAYTGDRSVGVAVGNTIPANPGRPTSVNSRYLRGRYVLVQQKDDPTVRKRITIGSADNTLFAGDSAQEVTINGVVFVTTGRVGEAVSFLTGEDIVGPPEP